MPTHKISSPASDRSLIRLAQMAVAVLAVGCASSPPPAIEPPPGSAPAPESATAIAQPPAAQQTDALAPAVDTAASEAAEHEVECATAEDCARGSDVPAGARWVCQSGACSAQAAAEPANDGPSPVKKKGKKKGEKGKKEPKTK